MITNKLLIAKRMKLELCISITIRYMVTYLNKHNFIILSSCSPPNPFPLCTVSPLSKCVSKKKKKNGHNTWVYRRYGVPFDTSGGQMI